MFRTVRRKIDYGKLDYDKLDQGEDRLTQTLVFPKFSHIYTEKYMVPKPFKKCYDGKCSHSTFFSVPQRL